MGSNPSSQENQAIHQIIVTNLPAPEEAEENKKPEVNQKVNIKQASLYQIPELENVIRKAHQDLNSRDPIGKKRYFFQVVNFIFDWLHQAMKKGMSLHDAQSLVSKDLLRACKDYPIGKIQTIICQIKDLKVQKLPNLLEGIQGLNKQKFTDRVKELSIRSKDVSYEFNKQMQCILEKQGGFKFKGGYKNTGVKAYMRILTKILECFFSNTEGSKQVYTDMDHYYWTPLFLYLNKIIDQNISKLKIEVYDWVRCRVFYKTIEELQAAYDRLSQKFGTDIFRVKNRINLNTRDILINMKYKTQIAEIQLALSYDSSAYDFNHKLYQLTREKLGVAFCCFTILLNELGDDQSHTEGVMTQSGYIKRAFLRQNVQDGFQRLTRQDAQKQWKSVQKLLGKQDVVALQTGVIRGFGYEKNLDQIMYGPEMSQMMIIKRRSDDPLLSWLNWMD